MKDSNQFEVKVYFNIDIYWRRNSKGLVKYENCINNFHSFESIVLPHSGSSALHNIASD